MQDGERTRRRFLSFLAVAGGAGVTGCLDEGTDDEDENNSQQPENTSDEGDRNGGGNETSEDEQDAEDEEEDEEFEAGEPYEDVIEPGPADWISERYDVRNTGVNPESGAPESLEEDWSFESDLQITRLPVYADGQVYVG
ncbi:MAG: twin-arginine translocation signal domain-containing protein, partial [Halobacteriales archaeon]